MTHFKCFFLSAAGAEPGGLFHGYELSVPDYVLHRDALGDRRRHLHLPRLQVERVRSWTLHRRQGEPLTKCFKNSQLRKIYIFKHFYVKLV